MRKTNRNNPLRQYQEGREWKAALTYIRAKGGLPRFGCRLAMVAVSSLGPYTGRAPGTGPIYAGWDLLNSCNARCSHCNRWKNTQADVNRLNLDEIVRVSNELRNAGTQHICLAGGEPLLLPELPDIISHMKEIGLSVSICTNGILLAEEAATLIEAGLDHVIVSVDGKPESHDCMRGVKGISRMVEAGIDQLLHRRGDKGPTVSCRMLVHEDNIDEIPWFVTRWDKIVDSVLIQPLHNGAHNLYELSNGLQIVRSTESLRSRLNETNLSRNLYNRLMPDYLANPDRFRALPCLAGHWVVRISPTGDVYPCVEQHDHVGNLRKESFAQVWRGARFSCVRRTLAKRKECHCWYNDMFLNLYMWKTHERLPILRRILRNKSCGQPITKGQVAVEAGM